MQLFNLLASALTLSNNSRFNVFSVALWDKLGTTLHKTLHVRGCITSAVFGLFFPPKPGANFLPSLYLFAPVIGAGSLIHTTFLIFTRGLQQLQKILRVIHNFLPQPASNPGLSPTSLFFPTSPIGSFSRVPEAVSIIRK